MKTKRLLVLGLSKNPNLHKETSYFFAHGGALGAQRMSWISSLFASCNLNQTNSTSFLAFVPSLAQDIPERSNPYFHSYDTCSSLFGTQLCIVGYHHYFCSFKEDDASLLVGCLPPKLMLPLGFSSLATSASLKVPSNFSCIFHFKVPRALSKSFHISHCQSYTD